MRHDLVELQSFVDQDHQLRAGILKLVPLARFARDCVLPPGFRYPAELSESVALTEEGDGCTKFLQEAVPDLPLGDLYAAILATVYYQELLVDVRTSDFASIEGALSSLIRANEIRYPFIYHRELYERYFDTFGTYSVPISSEETQLLLSGTSQGVFQLGELCVGPFGLLHAGQSRYVPPVRSAPLAHCRDPGCPGIHAVTCVTSPTLAGNAYELLDVHLRESGRPPSPWGQLFIDLLIPDESHYADVNSAGLLELLANTLGQAELKRLLVELLSNPGSSIRASLTPSLPMIPKMSNGDIADALDRAELLQALLLLEDKEVTAALDRLVTRDDVHIPATEVRRSPLSGRWRGSATQQAELSRFGVRFDAPGLGTSRLKALILQTHTPDELAWQLVGIEGDSIAEKVDSLVRSADVRDVVDRFLLNTREQFRSTAEYLRFGDFATPTTGVERERTASRVLWKLGFDVEDYPDLPATFRRRLEAFQVELHDPADTEERVEAIRSASVNVFVSLEDVLDEALAFSCFALLVDHYGQPRWARFSYDLRAAREAMVQSLGGRTGSAGESVRLTPTGRNNLFGLVHGFRELALLVDELIESEPDGKKYERHYDSYPVWARHGNVFRFPFTHTIPAFDLMDDRLAGLTERLKQVTKILLGADVMGVRNRVPHGGGEFPSLNALQLAAVAMDETLRLLEESGFSPTVYYPCETFVDRMGRSRRILRDYCDREFVLYRPSVLERCHLPSDHDSQVISRLAMIRDTSEVLRFRIRVDSEFSRMWADYPRLRVDKMDDGSDPEDKEELELISGQVS